MHSGMTKEVDKRLMEVFSGHLAMCRKLKMIGLVSIRRVYW